MLANMEIFIIAAANFAGFLLPWKKKESRHDIPLPHDSMKHLVERIWDMIKKKKQYCTDFPVIYSWG